MAKNSHIEWTDHTFNPWWGCHKVSPACDNCYADVWAKRLGRNLWGQQAPRRFFGELHWREPVKWNQEAFTQKTRPRVFCASMADVFELRASLNEARARLWNLIDQTPNLDWLLLTKRPQNILSLTPWGDDWPFNVWIGTSVENQKLAEQRLPYLLAVPAAVRFLSCEPLLGPLDLSTWFARSSYHRINWVIAGGESGPNSRPMHPNWVVGLLNQCRRAKVPFHFKQWGHWVPDDAKLPTHNTVMMVGDDPPIRMRAVGKKLAGRMLAGTTWDSLPKSPVLNSEAQLHKLKGNRTLNGQRERQSTL